MGLDARARRPDWVRARELSSNGPCRPRRWSRRQGGVLRWRRLALPATAVQPGTWVPSRRHRHGLTQVAAVVRNSEQTRATFACADGTQIASDLIDHVVVARLVEASPR